MSDDDLEPPRRSMPEPFQHNMPSNVVGAAFSELLARVLGVDWSASILAPALTAVARTVWEADRRQWEQAAAAVKIAADEFGGAGLVQEAALADPGRTELFRRVVQAAGRSTLRDKIPALGRVLANGLNDEARIDEALFLAAALADIEAAHVRVLATIADDEPDVDEIGAPGIGWIDWQLDARFAQDRAVLPAIVRTLERHALIRDLAPGTWHGTEGHNRWTISDLGTQCLDLLRGEAFKGEG